MKSIDQIQWPGWRIVRLIGRGSFGSVYEIERDILGETEHAALKVITIPDNSAEIEDLRDEGYDKETITSRFFSYLEDIVKEYTTMAKLRGHPNVVYCEDVQYVQHDDGIGWDIFIKMELLTPIMRCLDILNDEKTIIDLGIAICNALVSCKEHNIVHRDIKPQNIFISQNGTFKLGDFGIAKTAERTTSGTKVGTYKFMAPEVYHSLPYGAAADQYSLGLVLYWLLNDRRTPFSPSKATASEEDTARKRRFNGEEIPPPAHGSQALQSIVLKACAYRPEDRFASAEEMLRALNKLKREKISVAESNVSSAAKPNHHRTDKKKQTILFVVLGLLVAAIGLGLILHRALQKSSSQPPPAVQDNQMSPAESEPSDLSADYHAEPEKEEPASPAGDSVPELTMESDKYEFVIKNCSWQEAQAFATKKGGHLACFETQEEYYLFSGLLAECGNKSTPYKIGGRRSIDSTEYFWVDSQNNPYGNSINGGNAWCAGVWKSGEPSFNHNDAQETAIELRYDDSEHRWVWNDIPEDQILTSYAQYGYIIEYDLPDDGVTESLDQAAIAATPTFNRDLYEIVISDCTWNEAMEKARTKGGKLVSFDSRAEYRFVLDLIPTEDYDNVFLHIGGRRDSGGDAFYWVDGEDDLYGSPIHGDGAWCDDCWKPGEPNLSDMDQDAFGVIMYFNNTSSRWTWYDGSVTYRNPNKKYGYIVEYSQ